MKKVLIVDDEPLILFSLARALKGSGLAIKTVDNGSAAIEEVRQSTYQLCFLDLCLPDMNGIDVMLKIKQHSPECNIVIMSSSSVDAATKELIEKNASLFIPKPFELTYVKAIAQQLTDDNQVKSLPGVTMIKTDDERRRMERSSSSKTITCIVNCPDTNEAIDMNAHVVSISKAGMGIHTTHPVKPGSIIRFDAIEEGFDYMAGVVRNTVPIDNNMYRAGIEFI
ncbi:MAG: response regulator [Dissulfurispiraceae bacterium]|jgi:two-component system, OmpR family, response regulator VicR